jgi:F-type H+-transporting ATPase subunit a
MPIFAEDGVEEFDANTLISEHLADSYWWHITTINDRQIEIFLPVIVHSRQTGWHVFSSRHLSHGNEYMGFRIGDDGKIVASDAAGNEYRPWDISITKTVLALLINSAIMVAIFLCVARWYRRRPGYAVPRGFVGAVEMFVMSIEEEAIKNSIGEDYKRYSPYLLTAFFFIFINNIMGLIPIFPGGANITGNIAVTLVLAVCTFIAVNVFGNREYWREVLWPDVPTWLKAPVPLMPAIEIFGVISKPFALMIRLMANIMAGHTIMLALVCVIFITAKMGAGISAGMTVFSVVLSVFMSLLEILVAYIQAYVFTLLSAIFIGLSRPKHHGAIEN